MTTRWLSCLLVMASLAAPAYAQGVSVGAGGGVVSPDDVDASPWFTANARFHPAPWLALEPELGFWRHTDNEQGCVEDLDVCLDAEASVQDTTLGVNVLVVRPTGRLRPWGGAGLGAHLLEAEVDFVESGQRQSREETELGLHLLGGVDVQVTDRMGWFAAARYDVVTDVDLDQFKAYGGIRFKF